MSDAHAVHVRTRYAAPASRASVSKPTNVVVSVRPEPVVPKAVNHASRVITPSRVVSPRPAKMRASSHSKTVATHAAHTPASHVKARKQQSARTLMRAAVKRPVASLRRRAKAQTRTDVLVQSPKFPVSRKLSIEAISAQRQAHAAQTPKHPRIRHFAPDQSSYFQVLVNRTQSQPAVAASTSTAASQSTQPPKKTGQNRSQNRSMDIFTRALATANAHDQPALNLKSAKRKGLSGRSKAKAIQDQGQPLRHYLSSVVAVSAAVVVMAGFFAYQDKASITLRFASAKAGFHASLPSYQPAGYAAGKFHYSSGQVAVNYAKAGTSRSYTLSQSNAVASATADNAQALASKAGSYQTLQQGRSTIYLYGNGNAAWTNNGVLYQITSAGNLTTNDVLAIATSV